VIVVLANLKILMILNAKIVIQLACFVLEGYLVNAWNVLMDFYLVN
jgi:hypothetical protein